MARGKPKGNAFEREMCRRLSLWWTKFEPEPADDLFWRTANSGGRATMRGKLGKKSDLHCSDICALDERGAPLMQLTVVEVKRGYNEHTLHDLLDKPNPDVQQQLEAWFATAEMDRLRAGVPYWLIIHQRDRRRPLVYLPLNFINNLWYTLGGSVPPYTHLMYQYADESIVAVDLAFFLATMTPIVFRQVLANSKRSFVS